MWYHLQTKTSNRARKWHFAGASGDKQHLESIAADWQRSGISGDKAYLESIAADWQRRGIICRVVTEDEANA